MTELTSRDTGDRSLSVGVAGPAREVAGAYEAGEGRSASGEVLRGVSRLLRASAAPAPFAPTTAQSEIPASFHLGALPATIGRSERGEVGSGLELVRPGSGVPRTHASPSEGCPGQAPQRVHTAAEHILGYLVLEQTVDALSLPLVVVDTVGFVITRNEAARQLLRESRALTVQMGRLAATTSRHIVDDRYIVARRAAKGAGPGRVRLGFAEPAGLGTVRAEATRLLASLPGDPDRSIVLWLLILFPEATRHRVCEVALTEQLGLTRAEAEVAEALFAGQRLAEIGEYLGIARETVKKHLSRVFRKCGVNSQAQLVRLLAAGPFFAHQKTSAASTASAGDVRLKADLESA